MLKILVLLAISIVLSGGNLFANEYPIDRTIKISIPNHTTTVLEFPFMIKEKRFDRFKKVKKRNTQKQSSLDKIKVPIMDDQVKVINRKKVIVKRKNTSVNSVSPIAVKSSKNGNIIELTPNSIGTTKAIIWGYKHHPIMVHVNVVSGNKASSDYYKFLDYKEVSSNIVKFESSRHEMVVKRLLQHGYWDKSPRGFKREIMNIPENGKFYRANLKSVTTGKNYGLKSYELTNTSRDTIKLDNQMFYQKGSVYAVSIEKLNKTLLPNEKTRVFIVYKHKES